MFVSWLRVDTLPYSFLPTATCTFHIFFRSPVCLVRAVSCLSSSRPCRLPESATGASRTHDTGPPSLGHPVARPAPRPCYPCIALASRVGTGDGGPAGQPPGDTRTGWDETRHGISQPGTGSPLPLVRCHAIARLPVPLAAARKLPHGWLAHHESSGKDEGRPLP